MGDLELLRYCRPKPVSWGLWACRRIDGYRDRPVPRQTASTQMHRKGGGMALQSSEEGWGDHAFTETIVTVLVRAERRQPDKARKHRAPYLLLHLKTLRGDHKCSLSVLPCKDE